VRLTDTSFNLEQAATRFNGDFWLGDYEGLASVGNDFAAVWAMPDGSSTGKESIFFRRASSAGSSTGSLSVLTSTTTPQTRLAPSAIGDPLTAMVANSTIFQAGRDTPLLVAETLDGALAHADSVPIKSQPPVPADRLDGKAVKRPTASGHDRADIHQAALERLFGDLEDSVADLLAGNTAFRPAR
jgi:hypothetical protein